MGMQDEIEKNLVIINEIEYAYDVQLRDHSPENTFQRRFHSGL
jgi:hypothetical protein